jgi:inosine-uridine nucleoside N-ribohydrolase
MIKVIMDVDTGIDDAIAIMMALQSPEIEILLLKKGGKISQFISRILANYRKKEVSFVATGSLTNIAKAIIEDPTIFDPLSRICIMGAHRDLQVKFMAILRSMLNSTFTVTQKLLKL